MYKFDTKVQHLKYKVLREVARNAWNDTLLENISDIPKNIVSGKESTMRCCVYKERAILTERVKIAMGGDKKNPNVIEVIDIACDECPSSGYVITSSCRGCLAHRCFDTCKFGAITFTENHVARIDRDKCVNCGVCAKSCPYHAVISNKRPCETACKVKAIGKAKDNSAEINNEKCIACGACMYQCPFGSIADKSFILDTIDIIKESDSNKKYKVYAVVAPSISSQFQHANFGQVVSGIKELGFHAIVEAALGADAVALEESNELAEKGFLTSSCCPAFVMYINNEFPDMQKHISHNLSPMARIAKYIKETDPTSKVVFIGPCTAKKAEFQLESVSPYIDSVITFEELQALLDSKEIDLSSLDEGFLDNASYFGRIFARSGGLSEAVEQAIIEQNIEFDVKAERCNGIEECKIALIKSSKNLLDANFIEGMACIDGCIGGAGCLTHGPKDKAQVDQYGKEALETKILDAVKMMEMFCQM